MKKFNQLKLISVATLAAMLTGCELKPYAKTEIIEGYLQTPEGKFSFENTGLKSARELDLPGFDRLRFSYLVADAGPVKLVYSPLDPTTSFRIIVQLDSKYVAGDQSVHLDIDNSATRFSDGLVSGPMFKRDYANLKAYPTIKFTLDKIDYGQLPLEGEIPHEVGTDKTFEFSAPFRLNGVEFSAHLTFQKSIKKRLEFDIGVPATP